MFIVPIKNYTGYFIDENGKIYCNLGKENRDKNKRINLYEIKPRLTKNGYARVYMRNDITNKRQDVYIHRLVAEYFIPNPNNYEYVNHKNCNRCDNKASNLEWCSCKYNNQYTMKVGHIIRDNKGKYRNPKTYIA